MAEDSRQQSVDAAGQVHVPGFVTITEVTEDGAATPEYVLSNEATGRHFSANRATAEFFAALKARGNVPQAIAECRLPEPVAANLLKRMFDHGLLVRSGETVAIPTKAKAPLESRLVSLRFDLFDVGPIVRALGWVGRAAYSRAGMIAWVIAVGAMLVQLASNPEKIQLTMAQAMQAGWLQWGVFACIFVGLKVVHELGHALAYKEMCRAEGLSVGPIRVGMAIFALTPFPFTDVTGAWRLRSRWRRAMIGAGGVYFETWAMAALTPIWAQTNAGLLQTVILQVVIVSGALTLVFNLNPAVKLDGYFMLTDALRQPNLAARASLAARNFWVRLLGGEAPRPAIGLLAYWLVSYLYRWTIFAGIFWMLYQFDTRLAPLAVLIVVMTQIVRPMLATADHVRKSGFRGRRLSGLVAGVAGLVALMLIPVPSRLLLNGTLLLQDTQFVEATESARLEQPNHRSLAAPRLENPVLAQQITDNTLERAMLENLRRASFANAGEQARLGAALASNADAARRLAERRSALSLDQRIGTGTWTPLDARWMDGSWVRQGDGRRLGAISSAAAPHLRLRIPQNALTDDLPLDPGTRLRVRPVVAPECTFAATLRDTRDLVVDADGEAIVTADAVLPAGSCAADLAQGTAVVARLDTGKKSLAHQVILTVARTLQNRLPVLAQ